MAVSDQAYALTQAYRQQQLRQGATLAALVSLYYRQKVVVDDPASVLAWIELMLPKIMLGHDSTARLAAAYATALRRIEVPGPAPTFTPSVGAVEQQVKTSLLVVGPSDYLRKARQIESLDPSPLAKQAMLAEAKQVTANNVLGATMRHVQNGGRQTIIDASKSDSVALGYVRVTSDKPCFFCAMLASRGLVFADDSFDASDPRFTGDGTAKVHDNCACSMKAVYARKGDKALADAENYTKLWETWGAGGGDALLRFRRGYEHYQSTGEILPFDVVDSATAFATRNAA